MNGADLPTMISSVFEKIKTGILEPVLTGLYGIAPFLLVIGILVCLGVMIFSSRKGAKVGALICMLFFLFIFTSIPDFLGAFASYFGGGAAVDQASVDQAADATQQGMNEALDALRTEAG